MLKITIWCNILQYSVIFCYSFLLVTTCLLILKATVFNDKIDNLI
jgi:hypothetical protein